MSEEALDQEVIEPQEPTPEDKAREGGWVPQEEWQGNPDEWVPAPEFNFRGELMDRIKTQGKQLKKQERELTKVRQSYTDWQQHAQKVAQQEYEGKLKQLKQVKKEALEGNDYDLVVEADEKISELKESVKSTPTQGSQDQANAPEVDEWLQDNSWYVEDTVRRGAADALAVEVKQEMPDASPREILDEVTTRLDKRLGTKQKRQSSGVTEQQGGRPTQAKRTAGPSRLTPEQRKVGQRFVDAGALKDLKEYAQQLDAIGELG